MVAPSTLEEWQSASDQPCSLENWRGIVELRRDDLVVRVRTGTSVSELNALLRDSGLVLPYDGDGVLLDLINQNLPHGLETQHGTWRDWVLGLTLMLADGTIAKSGSMVVKSVAGYDVHKLMIGAQGRLAFVAEVTLRLVSSRSLAHPVTQTGPQAGTPVTCIQRVLASDWIEALATATSYAKVDPATYTLWHTGDAPIKRFAGDWLMDSTGSSLDPDPHPDLTERADTELRMGLSLPSPNSTR